MKIAKRAGRPGFVTAHFAALAVRYERGQLALPEPTVKAMGQHFSNLVIPFRRASIGMLRSLSEPFSFQSKVVGDIGNAHVRRANEPFPG